MGATTPTFGFRYPDSNDDVRPYEDIQFLAQDVESTLLKIGTKRAKSSAAGIGVNATDTKDAIGDLAFTAVSGYTYTIALCATAISAVSGVYIGVNIRDGGASSPTNGSPTLAFEEFALVGTSIKIGVNMTKSLQCPADIAAGTHTIAPFYLRDQAVGSGNVQLENAGNERTLSVTGAPTLP